MSPSRDIARLIEIMAALRAPTTGCAWDLAQTFETIAPYAMEEAAEVVDAVRRGDRHDLCDELGDLLLQVAYHAQLGAEEGAFDFGDVVWSITAKMIRRHPHVFGDAGALPAAEIEALWASIKQQERAEKAARGAAAGGPPPLPSRLDGVLPTAPALSRAARLQTRAASAGFEWSSFEQALDKVREELREIDLALTTGSLDDISGEIGDLLLAASNLARMRGRDPEAVLHNASDKFEARFRHMEAALASDGLALERLSLEDLVSRWQDAKTQTATRAADE